MARRLPVRSPVTVDPETMEELLASAEADERSLQPLRPGEMVEGTIASRTGDEILVDLGQRSAGVISTREASGEGVDLEIGDHVIAAVVQPEGPDGRVVLSLRRARHRRQWARMTDLLKSGELVEAPVVEANRGGVVVELGLRGFVPLSQLSSIGNIEPRSASGADVPDSLRALVGQKLVVRVIEADPRRDRLILSQKAAAQDLRRQRKAKAAAELREGDVLEGTVASITSFGVFVDVGVADGLVHRSEITWAKGVEPTALYKEGDRVKVQVVGIDRERQRISLSMKRLAADPWAQVEREIHTGEEREATITRVMPYGAFARVADGVEGLIHVSEISATRARSPEEVVRPGDQVRVRIVAIDPERRRLSLSLRQVGRE